MEKPPKIVVVLFGLPFIFIVFIVAFIVKKTVLAVQLGFLEWFLCKVAIGLSLGNFNRSNS